MEQFDAATLLIERLFGRKVTGVFFPVSELHQGNHLNAKRRVPSFPHLIIRQPGLFHSADSSSSRFSINHGESSTLT